MAVGRYRDWGVDEVIGGLGVSGTDSGSKTIRRQRTHGPAHRVADELELNNPFRVGKNRGRGEPAVGHAVPSGTFINNWHSFAIGLW